MLSRSFIQQLLNVKSRLNKCLYINVSIYSAYQIHSLHGNLLTGKPLSLDALHESMLLP